ncbi:MAG: winged helix-turn-helix transcriptional regulator [archaeon GB-1867-097]|nr:winged helix-turn-helix transcriptional regulator [Candidatus Culexmicrobium thermophilum]MCS7384882.1 winged helix-turn-helix transcriptional regulator [Candidatus Culexmicrobium thermophilum]HDO20726.1 winged helix-turn-helix transcriptional regulator [Candidatus Bathyarchaeota archaeon]
MSGKRRKDFTGELSKMVNSLVKVYLLDGRIIMGKLLNIDFDYLNLLVEEIPQEENREITLIPGTSISHVKIVKSKSKRKMPIEKRILSLLEKEPELTEEEIANILNVDLTRIRKAVDRLKKKGLLKKGKKAKREKGRTEN